MGASSDTDVVTIFADPAGRLCGVSVGEGEAARWTIAATATGASCADSALGIEDVGADTATPTVTTPGASGRLELVRVTGTVTVDGDTVEVDAAGFRMPAIATAKLDSVRLVGVWLEPDTSLGLLAVRPKGAAGQDRDAVEVIGSGGERAYVFDPRLSTTSGADGAPRRVGLELWLGAGSDDDGDQHSMRVAAEAVGPALTAPGVGTPPAPSAGATASAGAAVYPLTCRARGRSGIGLYALINAR